MYIATKKIGMMVSLMFILNTAAFTQPRGMEGKRENVEAMKIGYLTKELNLTTDEAKKFWPVYNEFSDELKKIRDARKERFRDAKESFVSMADKDVEKVIDTEMISRQQELDLQKQYHARFKEVLPIKKVALLYRAEEGFKRELLEKIKERREGGGGQMRRQR